MKTKELFNSLRITTMEVASPLIHLAAHRGKMIKVFIEYVQATGDDKTDPALIEMIKIYNEFAEKDQELVNIAQGKASEELL